MNRLFGKIKENKNQFFVCVALSSIIWVVFGQTLGHKFINYDDDRYVYANPDISKGLNLQGLRESCAITCDWNPATTISYRADYRLFGLNPSGYHLTNVLLHIAASTALFLTLGAMTGSFWKSAFVAALFAIHPLRAESVAWVSGRKDVLSGLFFMLCIGSYTHYVRRIETAETIGHLFLSRSWWRTAGTSYIILVVFLIIGLMSKSMLVSLPFVLILLDFWPLRRQSRKQASWVQLTIEKLPLLLISAVFCIITIRAEKAAIASADELSIPLQWRIGNAACAYLTYIKQTFLPIGLAAFYPHPSTELQAWKIAVSVVFLITVSATVLVMRKKQPYLLTGWLWYIGMMVPVIGLIQIGTHAHADRFTYLPQIGLFMLLVWMGADIFSKRPHQRLLVGTVTGIILTTLTINAWTQTSYWHDSQSIWEQTLSHTQNNWKAHSNLGNAMADQGNFAGAIAHYQQALRIHPDCAGAHNNLANILARQGNTAFAIRHYQQALRIDPMNASAHSNLGNTLAKQGNLTEAIEHYLHALRIAPNSTSARRNLDITLRVLTRQGTHLYSQAKLSEAARCWERVLATSPDHSEAKLNLSWLLATAPSPSLRNGSRAVELAKTIRPFPGSSRTTYFDTLAAAYAEAGLFSEAVATARLALESASGQEALAADINNRITLYLAGHPYHESE